MQFLGGRYRLVELLGEGGMSVVWRAYDEVLGRSVAVKVLAAKFAADAASRERIRAEAQAAAVLQHPNITSVYDYGESVHADGTRVPFVVMELVHGPSLSRRLASGPLPWRTAVRVCGQVAAALAAAHARGLVHRDVKPANVMLTANGVKVVDFGIAAIVGDASDTRPDGSVLGTPAYLAPERLAGAPVEPASDVYALGVLLFRTLAGVLPWRADTTTQMISAHRHLEPRRLPPIDGLPPEVADLCLRCMAKSPADRPTSKQVARVLAKVSGAVPKPGEAADLARDEAGNGTGGAGGAARAGATAAGVEDQSTSEVPLPAGVGHGGLRPASPPGMAARQAEARAGEGSAAEDLGDLDTSLVPRPPSTPPPRSRISNVRFLVSAAAAAGVLAVTAVLASNCTAPPGVRGQPNVAAVADDNAAAGVLRQSCQVRYQTLRDANGAFDVNLSVTNSGPAAVQGWTLEFTFPGDQRIMSARSAGWSQDGSSVVLHDQGDNAHVERGSTVTIGISGTYGTGNPLPTMFSFRKISCSYLLIGATGATIGAGGPAGDAGGGGIGAGNGMTPSPGAQPSQLGPVPTATPPAPATVEPTPSPRPTVSPTRESHSPRPEPTKGPSSKPTRKTRLPG